MGKSVDYKVEKKESFRIITKAGDVEAWWRIYATSKGGTYFPLEIRDDQLDKAEERLTAKAKALDAIL